MHRTKCTAQNARKCVLVRTFVLSNAKDILIFRVYYYIAIYSLYNTITRGIYIYIYVIVHSHKSLESTILYSNTARVYMCIYDKITAVV